MSGAAEWLRRSAERYRESWQAGSESWGRPIGALKALLIAGDDTESMQLRWTLDADAVHGGVADRALRRDAGAARSGPGHGGGSSRGDARRRLSGRCRGRARGARGWAMRTRYGVAVASVRDSFDAREDFLEDVPVADTALALDALAERRKLRA